MTLLWKKYFQQKMNFKNPPPHPPHPPPPFIFLEQNIPCNLQIWSLGSNKLSIINATIVLLAPLLSPKSRSSKYLSLKFYSISFIIWFNNIEVLQFFRIYIQIRFMFLYVTQNFIFNFFVSIFITLVVLF